MGMFDSVICQARLPGCKIFIPEDHPFQTKSLDCKCETYTLTRDNRLTINDHGILWSGKILMYNEIGEFNIKIVNGDIRALTLIKFNDMRYCSVRGYGL